MKVLRKGTMLDIDLVFLSVQRVAVDWELQKASSSDNTKAYESDD